MRSLVRALRIASVAGIVVALSFAQSPKAKDAPPELAAEGAVPEVGQITLDYTFKNLITGDGRQSMGALRGSVVLIDWWGIH